MHFHFVFSAPEILWTLTFAAELVLLVVLLGRDRMRRFPLFTANVVVLCLLLLVSKLLVGRISPEAAGTVLIVASCLAALTGILVVVELARRAFKGASSWAWNVASGIAVLVTCTALVFWGPWPAWHTLTGHSTAVLLRDLQMFADKGSLLYALLDIELGLTVLLFGRRFHGGWRSHPQMIAIGLSTAALAQLTVRLTWQAIALHTIVHSRTVFDRLMALRDRMYQANSAVLLCVLVWWIAWLWLDEPGALVAAEPENLADHFAESTQDEETQNVQS